MSISPYAKKRLNESKNGYRVPYGHQETGFETHLVLGKTKNEQLIFLLSTPNFSFGLIEEV